MPEINSLAQFVNSIKRASQFRNLRQVFRELVNDTGDDPEDASSGQADIDANASSPTPHSSKVGQSSIENDDETTPLLDGGVEELPLLSEQVSGFSKTRIEKLNKRRAESKDEGGDIEPTLVTTFNRDDGTKAEVIVGQSTVPQTIFNSTNVLIGVGLLGLPLGIKYSGWVIGMISIVIVAGLCKYTGSLLARCIDVDSSLSNYGDIAYIAFGEPGRVTTSALFTLELAGINVALVVLLADTLGNLIPEVSVLVWKIIGGLVLLPTNYIPLRYLSYASFVSVFAITALAILLVVAGSLKTERPGSLHDTETTYAFPPIWRALPLSFGLIMAPWSGLSVFPNVYRDMKQPKKYNKCLWWTILITAILTFAFPIIGYLMFGAKTLDEITKNVLQTEGYSFTLEVVILIMVVVLPLTKFALINHPIIDTLEVLSGIDHRSANLKPNRVARSKFLCYGLKILYRLAVTLIIVIIAIVIPSFELVTAIMGAFFAFLICVILPLVFHLRMFWEEMSFGWKVIDISLILASGVLGLCGTVWEFLPRSWIGIE